MKKIVYAVLATVTGLVMLFSYRTSLETVMPSAVDTGTTGTGSTDTGTTGTGTGATDTGSTDTGSDSTTSATASSTGLADGTYTGQSVNTRFGPVQVQITIQNGEVVAADAVDYPTDNPRDRQINQIAIPRLVSETVAAQSASIDMVSGATYTSRGYVESLQSALDQAAS